jgi:predicted dehydrogenase
MRNHIRPFAGVEVVASVDPDAEARGAYTSEFGLPQESSFASLERALAQTRADAVLVTASIAGHVPSAMTALGRGKHVLLEKPFAGSLAEARRVVAAAHRRGLVLMISQNYRFHAAPRKVAAIVRKGALGPVFAVSVDFRQYGNRPPKGKSRHFAMHEPLLVDMAIHHVDLMRMVLGREAVEVFCEPMNPKSSKYRDAPAAFAIVRFDGGAVASYRGSWISAGPATSWAGTWRMECEKGEIAWTSRPDDRVTLRDLDGREQDVPLSDPAAKDRSGCLRAFARAIATGGEPEASGRDNLGSLAIIEALRASARSGKPERVKGRPR